MTELTVTDVLEAQVRFGKNLDSNKNCNTCIHKGKGMEVKPCNECYIELFCLPVNPTEWKCEVQ